MNMLPYNVIRRNVFDEQKIQTAYIFNTSIVFTIFVIIYFCSAKNYFKPSICVCVGKIYKQKF